MSGSGQETAAGRVTIRRALLSVSDRTGLIELARMLAGRGVTLTATGGTGDFLRGQGIEVEELAAVSGFRELLGGRVKSLHPAVHAAILADRGDKSHAADLAALGIAPFDLVVGGLYPFAEAAANGWSAAAAELVDIGGPAMIRAAAKNHKWVTVIADPSDYPHLMRELETNNGLVSLGFRRRMAAAAFARAAAYDTVIADTLSDETQPERKTLSLNRVLRLRYGENPHQSAGFYAAPPLSGLAAAEILAGPELGYNNIADADAAQALVAEFDPSSQAACAIVKHGAPCGAAVGDSLADAFQRARDADPVSAFGGVIGLNRDLDAATAELIAAQFFELVIATGTEDKAVRIMRERNRARLLTAPLPECATGAVDMRTVNGGFLLQDRDAADAGAPQWTVATRRRPSAAEWRDLAFAWTVARHARSNAVVVARAGAALGIGSGRTSRVDAAEAAARPLRANTAAGQSAVAASDGFFPFADGVEALACAGVRAIVQPGGSQRDSEVIAKADSLGLAMALTGRRHFRH